MASNLDMTPIAVPNGAAADDVDRGATPKMSWPKQQFAKAPTGTRDRDLAKSVFESAIQANPHDSFTYHKLGLLYEEEYSDRTAAIQCFEHAVELNPKNAPALNSLGLACKGQDPQKALQYYQRCIAVEPEYGRAHKNLGLLYLNELNDHGKARQCFLECIRVDPNNASAFISLGQLCERQKEWKAAEDYFKMGVECDPRNPMGYFRLGILYQTLKNLEQSKYYYELAVSKAPTDVRIVSKLAKLLESDHFKDYVGARKLYRTALHYNPEEQWLVNRIRYIETKNIKTDPETGALMVQPQDNEIIPDINMNEMERANSSDHHAAAPNRGLCPRNHSLACIYAKPSTYRPQATWACEECHKSIGGVDLKVNGAYHCPICKYDLCSQCSGKPRRAHEIKPDESRKLGEGGFGVVYREYDYATRAYVAVKHVQTPTERMINDVKREVKIMRQFDKSPYIVKVLRADFDRQPTAVARIYLELMDSSVASLLDTQGPVHETQARVWIHNAACGLATLHTFRQQVLHRDIKPENLLLKDHKVKLSDFGLSKSVEGSTLGTTGGPKGTPQYTAPEIFESNPPEYTYAADIWSLACTWIVMVTGRPPWHGLVDSGAGFHALCYQLMQKKSPTIPTHLSQPAQDLLRRMLDFDRRRRPTAEMILADDYFKTSSNDIAKNAESEEDYERRRQAVLDARAREKEREKDSEHLVSMSSGIVGDGYLMTPTTGAPTNLGHFPAMDNSAIVSAMPLKPHPSNADLTSPQSPNGLSVVTTASMTRVGTASSVPEMEALGSNVDTTGSGGSNGTVPRSIAAPFVPQPSPGLSRNGGRGPINRQRPKFARAPPPPYSAADATNPATATSGSTSMVNSPPPAPSSATASPPPATDTPTVAIVMPPLSPDATRDSRNPPASAPIQESRRWVLSAVAIVAVVLLYSAAGV